MQEPQVYNLLPILLLIAAASFLLTDKLRLAKALVYPLVGLLVGVAILPGMGEVARAQTLDVFMFAVAAAAFILAISTPLDSAIAKLQNGFLSVVALSLLMLALSFIALPLVGVTDVEVLIVALVLVISSLPVASSIWQSNDNEDQEIGTTSGGWLSAQYLLFVPAYLFFSIFANPSNANGDILTPIVSSLIYLGLGLLSYFYLLPYAVLIIKSGTPKLHLSMLILATAGAFMLLANMLQIPLVLAAYTIGAALSGVFKEAKFQDTISIFRELFVALALISLGAVLDLEQVNYGLLLLMLLLLLPLKAIISTVINLWFGVGIRDSLGASLSQAQMSEFAVVFVLLAVALGWLDDMVIANTVLFATFVSILLTPVAYSNTEWLNRLLESRLRSKAPNLHRSLYINSSTKLPISTSRKARF